LVVEIEGRRFKRIKGDENHPLTKGYLCQKAARLDHYQNHGDRLQTPLKREADGRFAAVSWDDALADIAQRLRAIRDKWGGKAFATAGGGGQGNHLGGAYLAQIRTAMKSVNSYNSLGQEKTGDFWVNGRLFGSQSCHTTEDVEQAEFVIFLGCNPFQSHGIPNAREILRHLKNDPNRTMVVIDPRRTETAKLADIHLQLKPGTDAFLLSAMLAIIVRDELHDKAFIAEHCTGFSEIETLLRAVPIADYVRRADVPLALVEQVARGFAKASSACMRVDLGIQHTLHTTLNGYLEKLMYLITGNFGIQGGNNLHTALVPIIGNTDERKPRFKRTAYHKMFSIGGILPPNILPDEILLAGDDRIRAMIVDSCNPVLTWADSMAYEKAFNALELLVVVDVAMTETARLAHYVLPAASQFEKWEFTGFNLEFPANAFHLRHPILPPVPGTLPEPEIYTQLLEKLEAIPTDFPWLNRVARYEPDVTAHVGFMAAFATCLMRNKKLAPFAVSILYRTLGPTLPTNAAAAAFLLPLAIKFANEDPDAVRSAGIQADRIRLGSELFRAILKKRSGLIFSKHRYDDTWRFVKNKDKKVHLHIPELLEEWRGLAGEEAGSDDFPYLLMAGERRSYNANQIYRDPAWRKVDPHGAMRIHPEDATALNVADGDKILCSTAKAQIEAVVAVDDSVRRGVVTLPHGYGMRYGNAAPLGPEINRLTASDHCDPLSKTPYHKYVPVRLEKAAG